MEGGEWTSHSVKPDNSSAVLQKHNWVVTFELSLSLMGCEECRNVGHNTGSNSKLSQEGLVAVLF